MTGEYVLTYDGGDFNFSNMAEKIIVHGNQIHIIEVNGQKQLSLTDMARDFGDPNVLIGSWMRKKDTIEYLGVWEKLHNQNFKPHEFVGFRNEAGTNRFNISPQKWIDATCAIGITSKSGRYGGTYGNEDIAIYFGQWLSPEFSLYVVKEFKRLKVLEEQRSSKDWKLSRTLSKMNYRIHTDAIKEHLIPAHLSAAQINITYASEADVLNKALFGMTAKEWAVAHPKDDGNIRDHASVAQLVCLTNLESLNAVFIHQGLSQRERLMQLNEIAITQMRSLIGNPTLKKLK